MIKKICKNKGGILARKEMAYKKIFSSVWESIWETKDTYTKRVGERGRQIEAEREAECHWLTGPFFGGMNWIAVAFHFYCMELVCVNWFSTSRLGNEKYCSSNLSCIDARFELAEEGTEKVDLLEREEQDDDRFIELASFGSSLFLRFVISEKNCNMKRSEGSIKGGKEERKGSRASLYICVVWWGWGHKVQTWSWTGGVVPRSKDLCEKAKKGYSQIGIPKNMVSCSLNLIREMFGIGAKSRGAITRWHSPMGGDNTCTMTPFPNPSQAARHPSHGLPFGIDTHNQRFNKAEWESPPLSPAQPNLTRSLAFKGLYPRICLSFDFFLPCFAHLIFVSVFQKPCQAKPTQSISPLLFIFLIIIGKVAKTSFVYGIKLW